MRQTLHERRSFRRPAEFLAEVPKLRGTHAYHPLNRQIRDQLTLKFPVSDVLHGEKFSLYFPLHPLRINTPLLGRCRSGRSCTKNRIFHNRSYHTYPHPFSSGYHLFSLVSIQKIFKNPFRKCKQCMKLFLSFLRLIKRTYILKPYWTLCPTEENF